MNAKIICFKEQNKEMKILCIKFFTSSGSQDHVIFLAEVKPNKKKRKDDISIEIIRERN